MKLPNPERAIVELAKLRDYCLSRQHEHGKHKARVFAASLGIGAADAGWLRERLLEAASLDAQPGLSNQFGELYVIDFELRTPKGAALIRSGWIVRTGEDFPRLTTCYAMRKP